MTLAQTALAPDRAVMLSHLEWLVESACKECPELRIEIAWGMPDRGPNQARTFGLCELPDVVAFAEQMNVAGQNVYTGVTLKAANTPLRGRTKATHAALATCLPVDIDTNFVASANKLAVIAKPQFFVLSGQIPEARGQLYIRLNSTDDMEGWSDANRRSVHFCGGDYVALGTYRLMRLAGTVSYPSSKKQARGYCIEMTWGRTIKAPTYALDDLRNRFPEVTTKASVSPSAGSHVIALSSRGFTRPPLNRVNSAVVRSMLDALPDQYAADYDMWLRTGFALHYFDDGDFGLALWKRFSERCPDKANDTDFEKLWAGFGRDYAGNRITLGWLTAEAQRHGWSAPCRWDYSTTVAS